MASKEDLKKALCYPINLNYIYMIDGGKDDPEYREVVKKYLLLPYPPLQERVPRLLKMP